MTTVPVLWVSRHPEILARGYADQGMLEGILDRTVWRPPAALEFEHHEVRGDFPDVDGALVILPARHHASPEDVAWFKAQLDRLAWSVVLLCGDEEWTFPWADIVETETRRVWTMQPIPEQAHLSGSLPGGWYPGTHEGVAALRSTKDLAWFFAGQVTHARREQCVAELRVLPHLDATLIDDPDRIRPELQLDGGANPGAAVLHETEGYLQGMPQTTYWQFVSDAKVIPCPSGPMTVDTARAFEAMEAGCIPVLDTVTPRGDRYDYWTLLFGDDHPFLVIEDWADFPVLLDVASQTWPRIANKGFAFWQQYTRRLAHQLDDDIRSVRYVAGEEPFDDAFDATGRGPDDLITAIVLTSPTVGDPDTSNIVQTIDSIRAHLPLAEIIVVADGVRPEQAHMADDYAEYVRRLLWLCNFRWQNVVPIVREEFGHQGNSLRAGLELVTTPQILFVEHDTPLDEHPIDWEGLSAVVRNGTANMVRFHHEKIILPDHQALMLDQQTEVVKVDLGDGVTAGIPMRRSAQFWARPHLASTSFYRDQVMPYFGRKSRTMIEDLMYSVVTSAYADRGEEGWDEWRIWTYTPDEPHMQRSLHLDSRQGAPKFEMVYAYDDPPRGAPFATKRPKR